MCGGVGERTCVSVISNVREGYPRDRVLGMATRSVQFGPVAWWLTRNQIGRDLRELYDVSKDLPPELLARIMKLDSDLLFPAFSWRNEVDLLP